MRVRTVAAAALLAATLTACLPGSDDNAAPLPSSSSAPADDPRDDCLADLVKAYPSLDPDTPMLDQVDTCASLDDTAKSSVLGTLNDYDDAHRAAVDAATSDAP
ncbi:hypothetical protein [Streptomyces sp. UG1]|uniref:hypothetical protein n=1 Tax=Streptomyces sp. UG1 TaxID=3417652 RepID=UPI003CFB4C0E